MTKPNVRFVAAAAAPVVILMSGLWLWGCGGAGERAAGPVDTAAPPADSPVAGAAAEASRLAGTRWRLVEIQSMDDAQGTTKAEDPSLYTMWLKDDGTVAMRLNCNRAMGTWKAEPSSDPANGRFEFGPLAGTRALCPPPSLDERVTAQAQYVRGFLLKDGRLHLSLMADGGILVWEPDTDVPFETIADEELEAAIRKASPSYTKNVVEAAGATGRGRYVYSRIDLNGDGRDETFVYLLGPSFCGTGGCNLLLFTRGADGYALVNEFPISRTPVVVAPTKTEGWSDVFKLESGGGAKPSYAKYVFDGKQYVERERMPAVNAPEGVAVLAGEPAFDMGIRLEPAEAAAPGSGPSAPAPSPTGFATVCGVSVGGTDYRYRCTVEGVAPGESGSTVLHFPDNTVTIAWRADGKATATFEGMVPKDITVTTANGVTRFPFDDKVYFYASDRAKAAEQLKSLR